MTTRQAQDQRSRPEGEEKVRRRYEPPSLQTHRFESFILAAQHCAIDGCLTVVCDASCGGTC